MFYAILSQLNDIHTENRIFFRIFIKIRFISTSMWIWSTYFHNIKSCFF